MKKTLLCLFAFLLSVTAVNAQNVVKKQVPEGFVTKNPAASMPRVLRAPSVPNRIALDEGERIMGFYDTDDLDTYYGGLCMTTAGDYEFGVLFSESVIGKFVGGQITKVRFGLGASIGATKVRVYPVTRGNQGVIQAAVAEVDVATTQENWNDVILPTPVTIEPDMDYLISYTYEEKLNGIYPIVVDYPVNSNAVDGGFLIYGNLGQGEGWYNQGTSMGNLCIQAVVKGGSFIDDDIAVSGFDLSQKYFKLGGADELGYSFDLKNTGNITPTSYTLNVTLDGEVVETLESPVALSNSSQTYEGKIALPAEIALGKHNIAVSVATINGEVPTENVDDDQQALSFCVYNESVPRQFNVVEQFTSINCGYCPMGSEMLSALQDLRDDVAVVAIHSSGMDYGHAIPDPYVLSEGDNLAYTFTTGYPTGMFNRYYIDDPNMNSEGSLALVLSWNGSSQAVAQMFSESVVDASNSIPSFANVNIDAEYNEDNRQLTITVSGDAVDGFKDLVEDAALTVYLTEDNVEGKQINYNVGQSYLNYVHNNVLRSVVNENLYGDPVVWTGDNTYSNEYTVTLDDEWKPENMKVVAFIGRPITDDSQLDDVWVNNANMLELGTSTGIAGVTTDGEAAKEVARYSIDGAKVSAPVKGVNVVKMSDGSIKKVIVK